MNQWHDFKLAVYITDNQATIVAKKKNGLRFSFADTNHGGAKAIRLDINLASTLGLVYFYKMGKKWKGTITFYEIDGPVNIAVTALTKSKYERFLETDYHGFKLKK